MDAKNINMHTVARLNKNNIGFLLLCFNPSTAFLLQVLGYYSFAPYTNYFMPDSSVGSLAILVFITGYVGTTFLLHMRSISRKNKTYCVFGVVFLIVYGGRLLIEIFVDGTVYPPGNAKVLMYYCVSTIALTSLVTLLSWEIKDKILYYSFLVLCLIFLIGLSINYTVLLETASGRLSLEKINPISLAHNALSFIVFFFVFFRYNNKSKLLAAILLPLLFLVLIYARSRGAYISFILVLVFYVLAQRGTKRLLMAVIGCLVAILGVALISDDIKQIVLERLLFTLSGEDESTNVRLHLLKESWGFFFENIFLGKSILDPVTNYFPHNFFLEALIGTGFIGASFLLVHIWLCLKAAVGILRSGTYPLYVTLVVLIFIQTLFSALVSGSVWVSGPLMTLSFIILFVYYGRVSVGVRR